jgi:GxxExxY protein
MHNRDENELSKIAIDCAMRVHSELGAGLLESAYEQCLVYELKNEKLAVERQKSISVLYRGLQIDCGYRIDIVVENRLIIEVKAVESISEIHWAQILIYLKLSGCKLGLLINFNVAHLGSGIRRVVYRL